MALAMTWSVCESGQQSGRIENMNRLQRKGGAGVAAIFQFKTAYGGGPGSAGAQG